MMTVQGAVRRRSSVGAEVQVRAVKSATQISRAFFLHGMWWRRGDSARMGAASIKRSRSQNLLRNCAAEGVRMEGNFKLLHCHSSWWLIIRLFHIFLSSDARSLLDLFSLFRRTCTQCSGIQTRIMNSFECKRKLKGPQDVTEAHNLLVSLDCRANDDDNYLIIYGLIGVCTGTTD